MGTSEMVETIRVFIGDTPWETPELGALEVARAATGVLVHLTISEADLAHLSEYGEAQTFVDRNLSSSIHQAHQAGIARISLPSTLDAHDVARFDAATSAIRVWLIGRKTLHKSLRQAGSSSVLATSVCEAYDAAFGA